MREILFRGKSDGDLGAWIYGYYHFDKFLNRPFIVDADSMKRYTVLAETVGQYTGLQDKNGVRIFEGDVVKMNTMPNERLEVFWSKDFNAWQLRLNENQITWLDDQQIYSIISNETER